MTGGEVFPGGCVYRHRHAHTLPRIRGGEHFLVSDTHDRVGGHRVSLWSAWLSTQKKESTESGKNMGKGMWDGGGGGGGGRPVRSRPSSLCPLRHGVLLPGRGEADRRASQSPGQKPPTPGEQDAVQVRAAGSFFPTTFLRHGPRDSLICEEGRSPSSLSSKKLPHCSCPSCGPKGEGPRDGREVPEGGEGRAPK